MTAASPCPPLRRFPPEFPPVPAVSWRVTAAAPHPGPPSLPARADAAGPPPTAPFPLPSRLVDELDTPVAALAPPPGTPPLPAHAAALRAAAAVLSDTPARTRAAALPHVHPARTIADTSCTADVHQHCPSRIMARHPPGPRIAANAPTGAVTAATLWAARWLLGDARVSDRDPKPNLLTYVTTSRHPRLAEELE